MTKDARKLDKNDYPEMGFTSLDMFSALPEPPKNPGAFDLILQTAKASKIIADSPFVEGLAKLNQSLTLSHKLTSKKYLVWSLIERNLDLPTDEILQNIDVPSVKKLMESFQFSNLGNLVPAYYFDHGLYAKEAKIGEDYSVYIRERTNLYPTNTRYSQIRNNLFAWDQNIRFSIRALQDDHNRSSSLRIELFELVRGIIEKLLSPRFEPNYTKHANYAELGTQKYKKFNTEIKYCELCWRLTIKSAEILQLPLARLSLSNRHCLEHDPSNPRSKYRADHRYKKAFEQEILALQFPIFEKSNFAATFPFTIGDDQELRKAAYDLVHSKLLLNLHKLDQAPKKSLAAQVLELKQKGLKQSEIAHILGKSRQEISRANKKLQSLFSNKQLETHSELSS